MKNRLEICSNSCYSIARKAPNNPIIKGTKGLNRHFSQKKKKKKSVQKTNKYSISLIRETQAKPQGGLSSHLSGWLLPKRQEILSIHQGGEKRESLCTVGGWHAAVHGVAKSPTWLSDWTELRQTSSDGTQSSKKVTRACSLERGMKKRTGQLKQSLYVGTAHPRGVCLQSSSSFHYHNEEQKQKVHNVSRQRLGIKLNSWKPGQ